MARQDIGYDYEDFGQTAAWLEAKYGHEHPEFDLDTYNHALENDPETTKENPAYWDWVVEAIAGDDESIPGNDANGNSIEDQPIPAPTNVITDLDQFAAHVARWHIKGMKQAEHMLEMPDGYETEYVASEGAEPVKITLTGDLLIAFRMGVMTGTDAFMKLPFTYSLDEAAVEPEDAAPDN